MKLFAYARVSTSEQEESAHSLDAQEHMMVQNAAVKSYWITRVFREQGSGKDLGREKLQDLLRRIADGEADGLVVTRLDRLTRSLTDFCQLVEWFKAAEKTLVVLDFDLDTSTPAGELIAHMMAALAQWQRRVIAENTRVALAEKRRRGEPVSRPSIHDHPILEAQIWTYRKAGFTWQQIADQLNKDGVPTLRGGSEWRRSALTSILREKPARRVVRKADLPVLR